MKNLAIVITAVFFLAGLSANAQMHQGRSQQSGQQQGMMRGGMMHNMMKGGMMCPMQQGMMSGQQMPMKKYMRMVHMLPNMQEQLSLSQDQVEQLIDLQTSFKKQQVDYKADLAKKRMNLRNMMMNDASANDIESQLQACSNTKINMKVAAYETANNMKSVLTDEQKDNLQNMMQKVDMMQ
ncbi:MAG: Spy/CpxP family protein refolding chaperone, partial [Bacteroidales bacterium]